VSDDQVFLTTEQLAERYQTTPGKIHGQRKRGQGPRGIRFGHRILYSLDEVERWESEQADSDPMNQRRPA
jgi:hypothetical protein